MAIEFGFKSQKISKKRTKIEKGEARELNYIGIEDVNTDFYMGSLTQKKDKDTGEVTLNRHEIITMLQDEFDVKEIPYDLGLRVVEVDGAPQLQAVIKSEAFEEAADVPEYAYMKEYLQNGEFVIRFSKTDDDGGINFEVDEDAPTEYWLSKITKWDAFTLPTLKSALGTVGKIKLRAFFTNEGLNFETMTNRWIDDEGKINYTSKKFKGFSLQN